MYIKHNISLKPYNTFGIDVNAKWFCNISSITQLAKILKTHNSDALFILGGGSNVLLTKTIEALVLHINIKGISIVKDTKHTVIIKAMAGENWHQFVLWCLDHNFGGVENLSLIPGNIGTAPIQNIGAYGVELKDVFVSCKAINIKDQSIVIFNKADCKFGYRESVFKQELKDQYIITSVNLKLTKNNHKLSTNYGAIKNQLKTLQIDTPTIQDISKVVTSIRQSKLPDPKQMGNSGSFFKNPIISISHYNTLKTSFDDIPCYIISKDKVKVPAGWFIEKAGFKGKRFNNYGVYNKQALVLVNYGNANGKDIYNLAKLIQKTVKQIFNVTIETEVNII